jgi:outer membrane protein assembly factor BamB
VQVPGGKVLWTFPHEEQNEVVADPVPLGSGVFFSQHDYGMLLASEGNKPVAVWKNQGLRSGISTPVLVNGNLYGSDWSEFVGMWDWGKMARSRWPLRCVDARTGATRWETMMKPASAAAAGGRLLVLEIDGTLHFAEASPDAYREYSKADVFGGADMPRLFATPPVLLDGRVFCRNYRGDLICIDVRS